MPWKSTRDPYKIWLSEIILQQTRVQQGMPYYSAFIENYPTVNDLANAPIDDVLKLWQGLGYYSRGRNLHATAVNIVENYNGHFPETPKDLAKLKGVGPYTAAAIASFAFDFPAVAIDGNVTRVITRYFGITSPIDISETKKKVEEIADQLLGESQSSIFNQALIDFGAIHCTPKNPLCESCPFNKDCIAYKSDLINEIPFKSKKIKVKTRPIHYIVLQSNDLLAMKKRTEKDIWQGLYDFIEFPTDQGVITNNDIQQYLIDHHDIKTSSKDIVTSTIYKHQLSHQKLLVTFYRINLVDHSSFENDNIAWLTSKNVKDVGKPILIDKYLRDIGFIEAE